MFPAKLASFAHVEAWVQVCCPRLSIDWGHAFAVPLLSSYEAQVALAATDWRETYPMDYYSKAGGEWCNHGTADARRECCDRLKSGPGKGQCCQSDSPTGGEGPCCQSGVE